MSSIINDFKNLYTDEKESKKDSKKISFKYYMDN